MNCEHCKTEVCNDCKKRPYQAAHENRARREDNIRTWALCILNNWELARRVLSKSENAQLRLDLYKVLAEGEK